MSLPNLLGHVLRFGLAFAVSASIAGCSQTVTDDADEDEGALGVESGPVTTVAPKRDAVIERIVRVEPYVSDSVSASPSQCVRGDRMIVLRPVGAEPSSKELEVFLIRPSGEVLSAGVVQADARLNCNALPLGERCKDAQCVRLASVTRAITLDRFTAISMAAGTPHFFLKIKARSGAEASHLYELPKSPEAYVASMSNAAALGDTTADLHVSITEACTPGCTGVRLSLKQEGTLLHVTAKGF